ncbi:hypothetical protein [Streptomyces sp. 4F14]|uniref:hypothetical protein n=1 Tax=Streptomyces sp. 4F14 TaxID=3394380 RepID=UPI003A857FA2
MGSLEELEALIVSRTFLRLQDQDDGPFFLEGAAPADLEPVPHAKCRLCSEIHQFREVQRDVGSVLGVQYANALISQHPHEPSREDT